jgi:N-acetyl-anhydromuramyl-L-alanine amidase AmpD
VASRPWQWIVVHHSATPTGGAVAFDRMHKNNGWDELGYHFVIGNGTGSADGLVEVGSRWLKQKWGAHTRTPDQRYNNFGIGICLVGNFENTRPTPAQMQSLARLTAYLMKTYRIPADRILGHRDCKPTECPGHNVILADVRRLSLGALAELSGVGPLRTASTDLPRLPTNR